MEQIYTIPVNEKFDASIKDPDCGCPLCSLYRMLEENEVDLIMGASMMEPDIRIVTNKLGFCATHYEMMLKLKNRLSLALTLESHLDELRKDITGNFIVKVISPMSCAKGRIEKLEGDCYVCKRTEENFEKVISTVVYMWDTDEDFRKKFKSQPYFCLPHYRMLLDEAERRYKKQKQAEFLKDAESVVIPYFDAIREDIKFFCKKFDYRYADEPWGNAKNAPERAIKFLCSDIHKV